MASANTLDTIVRTLRSPDLLARDKLESATALRDILDHYTTGPVYGQFLKKVLPAILGILQGPPSFNSQSPDQKLRFCMLEIIHRFPSIPTPTEPFEPYAAETVDLLIRLIRTDNEDNAALCIKTACDILRHQVKACSEKAKDFLVLVKELFDNTEGIVRDVLDNPSAPDAPAPAPAPGVATAPPNGPSTPGPSGVPHPPGSPNAGASTEVDRLLPKGMQSFKVIAECPIIVVSIFQMYRPLHNIKPFIAVITSILSCQPAAQAEAHREAKARGTSFFGMSPRIRNKAAYGDYITLQVKMMSFLAYALRQPSNQLDQIHELPHTIVRLLQDCPRDKAAARKELIVAIRHIINFNHRKIFIGVIDQLLDQRTLMGDGMTVHETMRPLAYSMLADLIHHVRDHLEPPVIRKTVKTYVRNLLDDFPGTSFQTMSAKLLLNMAECIAKMQDKDEARYLLVTILNAIADKFADMNRQYTYAVKQSREVRDQQEAQQRRAATSPTALGTAALAETHLAETHLAETHLAEVDIFTSAMPIKLVNTRERGHDPVVDNKFLFKTLMHGLRNTVYQLRACTPPPPVEVAPHGWSEVASSFNAEEVQVIVKLFREGIRVFRYYEAEPDPSAVEAQYSSTIEYLANLHMMSSSKEEKELVEMFATVFHVIDPAIFNEIFEREIPYLFEQALEHPGLLHLAQFFLASEVTSPGFCGLLLRFLMDNLVLIGGADVHKSSVLLRMFKLAFMAVTLYSVPNEAVLLPHVIDIVSRSVELSASAQEPIHFFYLLRSLFRSIGGGKFEHLYKQILPLLEMLLDALNNLLLAARRPVERDLYVELCLTVPARLSNLLPHLNYLMRPLVIALRPDSDMVSQGLRTLELCVDNLTAEYLDPLMAPVLDELMPALYGQLRPYPYGHLHAHTAMRILGKLGGRNRKHMTDQLPLTFKQYCDDAPSFDVRLVGSKRDRPFNADLGLELALQTLMEVPAKPCNPDKKTAGEPGELYYKTQAFQMVKAQVKMRIGYDGHVPDDLGRLVRLQAQDLLAANYDVDLGVFAEMQRDKSVRKKRECEVMLGRLLKALFHAVSLPELGREAEEFLTNICRHIIVLDVGRTLIERKKEGMPFDAKTGEGPLVLDTNIMADVILESLASLQAETADAALRAIRTMYDAALAIFGVAGDVCRLQFFGRLATTFTHGCFVEEWFLKMGSCIGIRTLLRDYDFGDAWFGRVQDEFVRSLLFVIKDMPPDLPERTRSIAQDTLWILIDTATKGMTKEDAIVERSEKSEKSTPTTTPAKSPAARRLAKLCLDLAAELSHMNRHLRQTVKRALDHIAGNLGCEVWELLECHKDRLLLPLFQKPLRALPFATQIGDIEALTYYLKLKPNFVTIDENVDRLLLETLALSEASDESLAGKSAEFRTHKQIVELRVACIKILSTAMGFDEFQRNKDNRPSVARTKIVSMFFNSHYTNSKPTTEAANEALRRILMYTHRFPQTLLQQGLRPVLGSLQDAKRLTAHDLQNLCLLLRLLTIQFKVEIGPRLLDHVHQLATPVQMDTLAFQILEQSPLMKTMVGVWTVLSLLPPGIGAHKDRVIDLLLDVEAKMRRTSNSPMRVPLYSYLNRFPKECWDYLTERIEQLRYGRFLAQALKDAGSSELRAYCNDNVEALFQQQQKLEAEDAPTRHVALINTVHVVYALCLYVGDVGGSDDSVPAWMAKRSNLLWLRGAAKTIEDGLRQDLYPAVLRLAANQAAEQAMFVLNKYLDLHVDDTDTFLAVVEATTADELRATPDFYDHVYRTRVCNPSVDYCKALVLRCLAVYDDKAASHKTKSFLLHHVVNPIVAMGVMRDWDREDDDKDGSALLADKQIVESVCAKIWRPNMADDQDDALGPLAGGVDYTRMEVMQLTALLIKYHHVLLQDVRKDVIKFGWTCIRNDDTMNRNAAYVVLGYFIAHYETPVKMVSHVYHALLKTNQSEGRALVSQALELIAPVLPKRLQHKPGDRTGPIWATAPRRILAEESHNAQQTTSIFQFLVRHPDLFYESRDKFCMLIIMSLQRVVGPNSASSESKRLALNLMWLIWQWEYRRVTLSESTDDSPRKRKLDDDAPPPKEYQIPTAGRHKMLRFLIKFIAQLNEKYDLPSSKPRDPSAPGTQSPNPWSDMCKRAMALLYNLLQPAYWGVHEVELQSSVTDVVLASERTSQALAVDQPDKEPADEKFCNNVINMLQVVRTVLHFQTDEWVVENGELLQRILEKSLRSDNPEVHDCLHTETTEYDGGRTLRSIIGRILDAVPEDVEMDEAGGDGEGEAQQPSEFVAFLANIATETLSANNYMAGINILWSLSRRRPSAIDPHVQAVLRALQHKLGREHLSHYAYLALVAASGNSSSNSSSSGSTSTTSRHLSHLSLLQQDPTLVAAEMTPYDLEILTTLIIKAIDVAAKRIETLGDNRRPFLSVLANLVEKSQHVALCTKILDLVEGWVFKSEGTWPTLKEKTAVLHKMLSFEHRTDPTMLHKFLDLVIRIYEDPRLARTEITVRLETAFLVGTRAHDVDMRNRFMHVFSRSLSKSASDRLLFVIGDQNWEMLCDSFWLAQASHLLMGAIEMNGAVQLRPDDMYVQPLSQLYGLYARDTREPDRMADDRYDALIAGVRKHVASLADVKVRDLLEPLMQLQHTDNATASELWTALFPMFWGATMREDRPELERGMVNLLTKDYHHRQMDKRPNVVQALLAGASRAWPECKIPPHVMKHLARVYDAWYTAITQLERSALYPEVTSQRVRESNLDALVELYADLKEEDLYYGTWRRRCRFLETNCGLSYEQTGMSDKAQRMYEAAQVKARTSVIPFSQGEYMLWEDHWVICAQKLQQWDILQDFAKHENFQDLLLECAWRNIDMWQDDGNREQLDGLIKGVMDAPTPRRTFFQAFMSLIRFHKKEDTPQDFGRATDEAMQLSIRKWHQLPRRLTNAHIPLMQQFQLMVEVHDASLISNSLASTTAANLDAKSSELKLLLGAWRDRLPNMWDDILAWQDLVTWRQHVFGLINKKYLEIINAQQNGQPPAGSSFAYRGFHETAWIINRFAHVARKHGLYEVCVNQLGRIYTLPNIEIQEAFLKLREQAKCHFQNPDELSSGLDVINNTNLNYFNPQQKAEFYTLKGMFLERLGQKDDANTAFGTALFYDISTPKAWAEWGFYNDRLFQADPANHQVARQAVTCYLQASASYRNAKARKLIARILWLLSLDDAAGTVAGGFDDYKGEIPTWYWITFIPQLLSSLTYREAPRTHDILIKIAKSYPQSLYFVLRTSRDDMMAHKKNQDARELRSQMQALARQNASANGVKVEESQNGAGAEGGDAKSTTEKSADAKSTTEKSTTDKSTTDKSTTEKSATPAPKPAKKHAWDYMDEILVVLKSSFPLLALSMETIIDQIGKHLKCPPDEDAYRLIVALLNDAMSYISRSPASYSRDVKLPQTTEANITRFAETVLPTHIRPMFEAEFVSVRPTMYEYIQNLRQWRNKFEDKLDRRANRLPLETLSPHLCEFQYLKLDEIEIPGQYLQLKDKNSDFVRIERFLPQVELVRTVGVSHRRIRIRGHDGSLHPYAVQQPTARNCRREERALQLFRQLNQRLNHKKESRRRDLQFTIPLVVPVAQHIRLVQDDPTFVSMQTIYEEHCRENGFSKDDAAIHTMEKLATLIDPKAKSNDAQVMSARTEVFEAIQQRLVPKTVLSNYFQRTFPDFTDFFLFRRRFAYQFAASTFVTYILCADKRYPHKINISRGLGTVWSAEVMPFMPINQPYFKNPEAVPFRLTPNLHALMGPLAVEGIFTASIMAIARCLADSEQELSYALTLFVRDDMIYWFTSNRHAQQMTEDKLRRAVLTNVDLVAKRAASLAHTPSGNLPAYQTVIDLIAKATNPVNLAMCDVLWMSFY